jgi:thiol-disulfide isomerase/thioredoxin
VSRISVLAAGLLAVGIAAAPAARAATETAFTQAAFAAAQHEGKPILVHITASWCIICAAQRPILAALEAQPDYKDLDVFEVDYDAQKGVMRSFGVQERSTLIVFHGATEMGRSTGDTDPTSIAALLSRANQ